MATNEDLVEKARVEYGIVNAADMSPEQLKSEMEAHGYKEAKKAKEPAVGAKVGDKPKDKSKQ